MKRPTFKVSRILLIGLLINATAIISNGQVFTNPVVEKVADGFIFVEGPVWLEGQGLLFSDIPGNKVYLFGIDSSLSVFKTPSGNSNGLSIDKKGNLILCQHGLRQVGKLEENGEYLTLAADFEGKRLNSPNDLHIATDGSIFFTDPPYGLKEGEKSETGFSGIYHLMPSGKLYLLDSTLNRPNGIVLSTDEKRLIVSDSEARSIFVWNIVNDSTIVHKIKTARMEPEGYTDGMKTDTDGYLYSTGPRGIWIFSPDGVFIKLIEVPGQNTNCAWGGTDRKTLYVTSGNTLYRIRNK